MQEEIFTFEEACSFLKISHSTGYAWIKASRLRASRTGIGKKKGDYRILKSDCIASITTWINNQPVNAVDQQEEGLVCQSSKGAERGTVTSLRLVAKDLDSLLGQRTSGKLRNSTIN
ncbi:helix-turn-helix domain-containing protein [Hafnia psychrotolerans]|uniref:helix-turn-helix domain-containing protein n=1 Tax=Hafnia psychrotolerans TaxID=1477018 RepID=UPI001E3297E6|nr:helix-turn-helix domain-containing protein [Hafnia psychrotolerans]